MKYILTINVGSSSIKSALFRDNKKVDYWHGTQLFSKSQRQKFLQSTLEKISSKNIKLHAVIHRVVHGKDISSPKKINVTLLKELYKIAELAPLHEIPELEIIDYFLKNTKTTQIAVFDTSFHSTIPRKASLYGLPLKYYKEGIKKYGFHGISHKYVTKGVKGKVISCHIGNGCSIAAIRNGKSIDTSMGFTPLDGLIMGTRSGSIDPAIVPYLMVHKKISVKGVQKLLNNESGLLGISGKTHDVKKLLKSKNKNSILALDAYIYRIALQIGAYAASLNGVDAIIFTGGVTEKNPLIRKKITDYLSYLGVKIDARKNNTNSTLISNSRSKVKVMVVQSNEEKAMLEEAKKLLR